MFGWSGKRRADVPKHPPPIEPVCFVCDGSLPALERDGPGHWLGPRYACRNHCRAALLSSGESLASFLARHTGDSPLEGSGLGWLLNPVFIAGTRAWADFAGGGWAVLEEVFTSDSQFAFWAQHRPDCVEALYQMYPPPGNRVAPDAGRGRSVLSRSVFMDQWNVHCRIENGFRGRRTRAFTYPAELFEFWDSLFSSDERPMPVGEAEFDEYLRCLAGRRFRGVS
jgi:hypothetical protein